MAERQGTLRTRRIRSGLPGTGLLAWRNLTHERARFIITLIGITFSVVLMAVQLGLLIGFSNTSSTIVDHTRADIWLTPAGTSNVDIAGRQATRWRQQALALPGVVAADLYLMQFGYWRKPDGGTEGVMIVGFNMATQRGGPWNLIEGSVEDLQQDDAVILDVLYKDKLGVTHVGQTLELNARRVRVVGFTQGVRTFTQTPYVFASYRNALAWSRVPENETSYVLIETEAGADAEQIAAELRARLPHVDVWTRSGFSTQTQVYWMLTTGAGSALLMAAVLGLVVGIVIVGQTLYASTVDRIDEYATLRAMGASNAYLYRVVIKQALISATLGYVLGISLSYLMAVQSRGGNVLIDLPSWTLGLLALMTVLMCLLGALASIRRLMTLDPTSVFK